MMQSEPTQLLETLINPVELNPLGFSSNRSGGHMARSMMFTEIQILCNSLAPAAALETYYQAVVEENQLGKPTFSSRKLSYEHLRSLYGLDPSAPLFRVFRLLGAEEPEALPTLALVCCYCRDLQLRASFPAIETLSPGDPWDKVRMRDWLSNVFQYSPIMLEALAQRVNGSWTTAGHLSGKVRKIRRVPDPHPASTAFALFAGWLTGLRGRYLLDSVYPRLVLNDDRLVSDHLNEAGGRDWVRYRSAGGILEIDFSPLLEPHELEALHVPH